MKRFRHHIHTHAQLPYTMYGAVPRVLIKYAVIAIGVSMLLGILFMHPGVFLLAIIILAPITFVMALAKSKSQIHYTQDQDLPKRFYGGRKIIRLVHGLSPHSQFIRHQLANGHKA